MSVVCWLLGLVCVFVTCEVEMREQFKRVNGGGRTTRVAFGFCCSGEIIGKWR